MGCCVSTHHQHRHSLDPQKHPPNSSSHPTNLTRTTGSRAPPPSIEEETVKEVLSETPAPKPTPIPIPIPLPPEPEKLGLARTPEKTHPAVFADETSAEEVSEICSLSESISTTATNLTDDGGVHARPRVDNRSPAKRWSPALASKPLSLSGDLGRNCGNDSSNRRDRVPSAKLPARRSDRSPSRINGGTVRMVQSREPCKQVSVRGTRSDPGDRSARRSRSPATRAEHGGVPRTGVGRSPSVRKTNPSPGRVRPSGQTESRARVRDGIEEGGRRRNNNANESLDNPLVSLECFIFL